MSKNKSNRKYSVSSGSSVDFSRNGSILDFYFQTNNGQIKLINTTVMGLALLIFTLTGFWLWYGPKRMRQGMRT